MRPAAPTNSGRSGDASRASERASSIASPGTRVPLSVRSPVDETLMPSAELRIEDVATPVRAPIRSVERPAHRDGNIVFAGDLEPERDDQRIVVLLQHDTAALIRELAKAARD